MKFLDLFYTKNIINNPQNYIKVNYNLIFISNKFTKY